MRGRFSGSDNKPVQPPVFSNAEVFASNGLFASHSGLGIGAVATQAGSFKQAAPVCVIDEYGRGYRRKA